MQKSPYLTTPAAPTAYTPPTAAELAERVAKMQQKEAESVAKEEKLQQAREISYAAAQESAKIRGANAAKKYAEYKASAEYKNSMLALEERLRAGNWTKNSTALDQPLIDLINGEEQ